MADREKVIKWLAEEAVEHEEEEVRDLAHTALLMLEEQKPRVMTLEEVINAKDKTDVWLDEPDCVVVAATISNWIDQKNHAVTFFYGIEHTAFEERDYMNNNYNRTWRCWTSRPTPEQMRETKWEENKDDSN